MAQVRGKTVYLQYSTRNEIINSTVRNGEGSGNILLISLDNMDVSAAVGDACCQRRSHMPCVSCSKLRHHLLAATPGRVTLREGTVLNFSDCACAAHGERDHRHAPSGILGIRHGAQDCDV